MHYYNDTPGERLLGWACEVCSAVISGNVVGTENPHPDAKNRSILRLYNFEKSGNGIVWLLTPYQSVTDRKCDICGSRRGKFFEFEIDKNEWPRIPFDVTAEGVVMD